MKSLIFIITMTASLIGFAQSDATTARMVCISKSPDGDLILDMIFAYDIDSRTYTLSKVGASGRGTTVNSPDYHWAIKSDIDLSRLASDVELSQPDGSYIQFTMVARESGIVMRRGEDGFFPERSLDFLGEIKGKAVSGTFKCRDFQAPVIKP